MIKGKNVIFLIKETKLDNSFPSNQFAIPGYKFLRKYRKKNLGQNFFFNINDQLPSWSIKIENFSDVDLPITEIEIAICKNKILVAGIYKPPNLIEAHFNTSLETVVSKLKNRYEKIIFMGHLASLL